ncbi:MAG: hypothetical protein FJ280_16325 [Planctomycetes bacterium]|nr:hypothetical protein [Planctomycetota bacterium]
MIGKWLWRASLVDVLLVCWVAAGAELRLPAVISDNMVLQCGRAAPLWGWAAPGEEVTVALAGRMATGQAGNDGRWRVLLPALEAQEQGLEMVVRGSGGGVLRVKNVVVGEVWLCCGPSNLFWPVRRCDRAKQEIAAATYPRIRFFMVGRRMADEPQADCEGRWVECSPASVPDMSGVGYFFARQLHEDLKTPVGLMQSFWGGSRIEAWTSREALQANPALQPILDYWSRQLATFDPVRVQADHEKALAAWQSADG